MSIRRLLQQLDVELRQRGLFPSVRFPLKRSPTLTGYCAGRYDWVRSAWLVATAGSEFWRHVSDHRGALTRETEGHPIDDAARTQMQRLLTEVQTAGRQAQLLCVDDADAPAFQRVAVEAGLGVMSRLGLILRPDTGTWFGLRAILLTDIVAIDATDPVSDDLCLTCPGYCADACVGDAFVGEGGTWDWQKCSDVRIEDVRCADQCQARLACPHGEPYKYEPAQLAYHYGRSLITLRQYLHDK